MNPVTSAKQTTAYLVLYRAAGTDTWTVREEPVVHKGSNAAQRWAIEHDPAIRQIAENGGAEVVAVPARSWQPLVARVVTEVRIEVADASR